MIVPTLFVLLSTLVAYVIGSILLMVEAFAQNRPAFVLLSILSAGCAVIIGYALFVVTHAH